MKLERVTACVIYLTLRAMFPEISARQSLLICELSFRCLSPGSEGEKCRPLKPYVTDPFPPLNSIDN